MKKDKSERITNSVAEYLKKRNYEGQNTAGNFSEKEIGMLGLLDSSFPNSYCFSAITANPHNVEYQFLRFKSWMMEASEPCRSELSQLLFPLFVYIYLELGASAGKSIARTFFQRHFQVFRVNKDYELTLRQIISSIGDQSTSLIRTLRNGKYQVRLSDNNTLQYLLRYLKAGNSPTVVQILNRYIEIELEDGLVTSSAFAELEKKIADGRGSDPAAAATSSNDCTAEELAAVTNVINNARALTHPGVSVALYSLVNAYNGVCCADISSGVDMLACGFEDSVVKVWSLVPHWPCGGSSSAPSRSATTLLACEDLFCSDDDARDTSAASAAGAAGGVKVKVEGKAAESDEAGSSAATSSSSTGRGRKLHSGGEVYSLRGHSGPVYDVAFTRTAPYLASASEDTYMRLWSMTDGECVAKYAGHNYPVFKVAVSPFDVHAATGSFDQSARLWSFEYLHPLRVFAGHTESVTALAFHPNCSYLATGSRDHSVRLWQLSDANAVRVLLHHSSTVTTMAFAPNGKYLASGCDDGSVIIWDLASGKVLTDLTQLMSGDSQGQAGSDSCVQVSWSPDSRLLITASLDAIVRTICLTPSQEPCTDGSGGLNNSVSSAAGLDGTEVQTIPCGSDSTLLHASFTQHGHVTAVVAQQLDR